MGEAIGAMLGFAAGVAVSPFPIVAMILLLATPRARVTGIAFAAGWMSGLAVLVGAVLLISGPSDAATDSGPATWTGWVKLALGVVLLLFAIRGWRGRNAKGRSEPKWMASIDSLNAVKSFGLGAVLSTVNPKNAPLAIAAGVAVAATGASGGAQAVAAALFVVISSLGVLAPLAVFLFAGDSATRTLESWKAWFVANNAAIMAVLFFVIGLKLVGDGITVLA